MMIDNIRYLKEWMKFEPGTYYKFVALVRAKDFKDGTRPVLNTNERGEIFVRQWFVDSEESFEKYRPDMINLCIATKARLYVTTDRKSIKKTILTMKDQLDGYIKQLVNNPNAPLSIRKLSKFSASASQMAECSDGPKYWLIDIDGNELEKLGGQVKGRVTVGLSNYFKHIFINHTVIENMTPNGFHLLIKRDFDIHKVFDDFMSGKGRVYDVYGAPSKEQADRLIKSMPVYDNDAREFINKWKECWSLKDNALTLVFMDFEDIIM